MPRHDEYPRTVAEVLDPALTFKPEALRALCRFRRSRPWRGTVEERKAKIRRLNRELAAAYGVREPALSFAIGDCETPRGNGCYARCSHSITLVGRLSVLTYLHEFAHARGYGERGACRWSINLFRRAFPRAFARLTPVGHTLVRA
jgi:hypothetical protein